MRFFLVSSFALALLATAGCTRAPAATDAGSRPDVGPPRDTGQDAPAISCTTDADCDDAFPCTFDQCIVGNVCDHRPLDAMCAAGEHCSTTMGCSAGCNVDGDCDDMDFCNGTERCLDHMCLHDADRNCDDGQSCTIDSCDPVAGACAYMTTCDGGVVLTDAGPLCTPFVAPGDFTGTYLLAPSQNQGCGITMYTISTITMTATGTSLSVTGLRIDSSPVAMSGTSTGSTFSVSYSDSCGTYTLTGNFTDCREAFSGHWSASFGGSCGICVNMNADVTGLRR